MDDDIVSVHDLSLLFHRERAVRFVVLRLAKSSMGKSPDVCSELIFRGRNTGSFQVPFFLAELYWTKVQYYGVRVFGKEEG